MGRTKKLRAHRTHGRGRKAGRGKGKRGGRGQAGLLKHKFKWMLKYDPEHFGSYGFTRHKSLRKEVPALNLGALEEGIAALEDAGFAKRGKDQTEVDLTAAGIGKLLGGGRVMTRLKVIVPVATARAVAKVEAAGGEVVQGPPEG